MDIGGPLRRAKYVWILRRLFLRGFFNENLFSIAVLEKTFTFIPSTSDKNHLTQLKDLVCVPLFLVLSVSGNEAEVLGNINPCLSVSSQGSKLD